MFRVYASDRVWTEADAPLTGDKARDVQVIAQPDAETGVSLQSGADYYVWRGGRWQGVDIFGLFDYLLDTGLVLFGRTIDAEEYAAIMARALDECGPKSAWKPGERRV